MNSDEWDAFINTMADDMRAVGHEALLWRVTNDTREITCQIREIRSGADYVVLELRVEHNGQMYLTELHKERSRSIGASMSCAAC